LEPLETARANHALGKYLVLRMILSAHLTELAENRYIGKLDYNQLSLAELSKSDCFKGIVLQSNAAQQALETVKILNSSSELAEARRGNYLNDFSIYRWKLRINNILLSGINYENLTFGKAKELSDFEYPDMSQYEKIFRRYTFVDSPWVPVSVRFTHAVILIELGLFLALGYFWLMFFEATESGASLEEGTIFTAMRRTTLSRLLFFIFISIPPIATCLLVMQAYRGADALTSLYTTSMVINGLLFIGIVIMSARIWRTAQQDWI
jgi:hypothetical protein